MVYNIFTYEAAHDKVLKILRQEQSENEIQRVLHIRMRKIPVFIFTYFSFKLIMSFDYDPR